MKRLGTNDSSNLNYFIMVMGGLIYFFILVSILIVPLIYNGKMPFPVL
jgi:hypothetical protein